MNEALPALQVLDLRTRYGSREVLKGLNLQVAKGEIFGLLGPNGAGKTTLIRTIAGRIRPVGGAVAIMGRPVSRHSMRRIGLVPQEIALYPHLTAQENLEVFGRLSGLNRSQTQEAVRWAGEAADIEARLGERVEHLSGGWKRRVNIAAAILHRPDLLILDEPTVGVDVDARNGLHEVIKQLSHLGMGVLLATHDLDQAELLCSRVGFLRHGVIAPHGSPRTLIFAAFGNQREIIIELRAAATKPQAEALQRAGFAPSNGNLNWSMMGESNERTVQDLTSALERAGLMTREIRVREPGLDSLFLRLSRDAATAARESEPA
ncbi:ABC transporter ATP-binding protein [Devosia aurantiaca]|uniref:ABC transporter ATP-binding protein n=1 Tax=Devosia aurantiaca TaxID=2714858 RepID=A0A6M1SKZ7_9HYPH|nr:ABC transporter ATP-binding protein [Devosia aurantiaca]NGP17196.1 ABC transporter ATP-binding protein [Devosia aurantiaca]